MAFLFRWRVPRPLTAVAREAVFGPAFHAGFAGAARVKVTDRTVSAAIRRPLQARAGPADRGGQTGKCPMPARPRLRL